MPDSNCQCNNICDHEAYNKYKLKIIGEYADCNNKCAGKD